MDHRSCEYRISCVTKVQFHALNLLPSTTMWLFKLTTTETVLASIIIDHLQKYSRKQLTGRQERLAVLYIYLDHTATKIQTLRNLFGSLLKQLVQDREQHTALPQSVTELYEKCKGEIQPSVDDYINVLKKEISNSYKRVFVVVDALDEFPEEVQDGLHKRLEDLAPGKIGLLITSREIRDRRDDLGVFCSDCYSDGKGEKLDLFYHCKVCNQDICQACKTQVGGRRKCGAAFCNLEAPTYVVKEIKTPDEEIKRFVDWELKRILAQGSSRQGDERTGSVQIGRARLGNFCDDAPELKVDIPTKITQEAQGMFLLAKLHLESLKRKRSAAQVREALDHLEKVDSVVKMYENMFDRVKGLEEREDVYLAKKALSWVVNAQRDLTVRELQHVLAIGTTGIGTTISEVDLTKWKMIQSITSGFLVKASSIEDVGLEDDESAVVKFVHKTAQEFCWENRAKLFAETPSTEVTIILTYLSLPSLAKPCDGSEEDTEMEARLEQFPFFAYACQYVSIPPHGLLCCICL